MVVCRLKSEGEFAEIQKTEGKPCRALDQGEAIFTLIGSQGFVPSESRFYTRQIVSQPPKRHNVHSEAKGCDTKVHEIGRGNLPQRQILSSICPAAARKGAPQARQVADRYHLTDNLRDARRRDPGSLSHRDRPSIEATNFSDERARDGR
jgi:hypothetical protein